LGLSKQKHLGRFDAQMEFHGLVVHHTEQKAPGFPMAVG
jgi:hypothetical protein